MPLVPVFLIVILAVLSGCRKEPVTPAATRPATPQISTIENVAAKDFVAQPVVDPQENMAGPARIITVAPNLTELVWSLGLGDRQVGRTQYCTYPPAAKKVEIIGALLDPNMERIVSLAPDLVLLTSSSTVLQERFARMEVPVKALPDSSLDDIFAAIEQLGHLTGRPKTAAGLVEYLRSDLSRLEHQARVLAGDRRLRVLLVTGSLPSPPRGIWVAGPGGYLDTLLTMASVENTAGEVAHRPWLEVTPEQVAWQRPDVIVEVVGTAQGAGRADAASAWRALPGLSGTRIVTLEDPAMLVPGPRVNVMLAQLIAGLYGSGNG